MTTPTDLIAQAEAVMDGVTPGPWFALADAEVSVIEIESASGQRVIFSRLPLGMGEKGQIANARFIAWCRAGVPALIARIRELEGERERARHDAGAFVQSGLDWKARAEAAEAKLAEVTASNAEWTEFCVKVAQDEMRATVATLTAQVEAMRRAADPAEAFDKADWFWRTMDPDDCGDSPQEAINRAMVGRFCVCEIASSYSGPTRYGFIAPVLDPDSDEEEFVHFATQQEAIDAAKARAALTTENQTNG